VEGGDDLEGAVLDAAVRLVAGAVGDRDTLPGQALHAGQQEGLVGLDTQQVVGVLVGEQELGGVGVGVERVLPRRNLDAGLAGGRLRRSGAVRISSYFRSL
jgi:hypothetical protein